jgi:hypothetical protein
MARYIPTVKTLKAVELAELFITNIVSLFGIPTGIVTDRGSVFTSEFWSAFCYATKVKRKLSTAFHPQTDGQTERQNQTLEHYLRVYCDEKQGNWAPLLSMAEFAYNNAKNETLGCSPFRACYTFEPALTYDEEASRRVSIPAAAERAELLERERQAFDQRWQIAVTAQAKYYNQKHQPKAYAKGELVMLSTKNLKQKVPSKKLAARFIGPFKVDEAIGTQAYRLHLPTSYRIHNVFHVSLLEPYHGYPSSEPTLPGPVELDDASDTQERYTVEAVLDRKRAQGGVKYLVKWQGWPEDYNQWISEEDIDEDLLQGYQDQSTAKAQPKRKRKARK